MKIYVASSWRNGIQPEVIKQLRENTKHEIYDFREPQADGARGFAWSEIDPDWKYWNADQFKEGLKHDLAEKGFESDMNALESAGATLLVLPCGRSAHLELGAARGFGQRTAIYMPVDLFRSTVKVVEPELMYKMVDHIWTSMAETVDWASNLEG